MCGVSSQHKARVMSKMGALYLEKLELAQQLKARWEELEESGTAEMAAYSIACEQLDIDEDTGYELLALLDANEKMKDTAP